MKRAEGIVILIFVLFPTLISGCRDSDSTLEDPEEFCLACPINFNTTDSEPAWGPNGKWIAFVHSDRTAGKSGIYLVSPDGQKLKQWHQGLVETPAWSPDGQWLAFSENAQIWIKKIDGDSIKQLTFEGRNFFPAWSPDGNLIAHNESVCNEVQCGIWLINLGDSTHLPIASYGIQPEFHPLNSTILYQRRWADQSQVYGDSLFYYDQKERRSIFFRTLQQLNHTNKYFKIDPSGGKIAFTSQSRDTPSIQIWTMNINGSDLKQLTNTLAYSCDWSPDGKYIVYTDARRENGRLWIMDADGNNKSQLTFEHHF